jgi:predicted ATPase
MRLIKARVQKYRSIRDTGEFEVDLKKTILVGPNEAGKTALLQALQQLNPPPAVPKFDALRDYPRSEYNDITTGAVKPVDVEVATGWFALEDEDKKDLPPAYHDSIYVYCRKLDNSATRWIKGGPAVPTYKTVSNDLLKLVDHVDRRVPVPAAGQPTPEKPSAKFAAVTKDWQDDLVISVKHGAALKGWLDSVVALVDEGNAAEMARLTKLQEQVQVSAKLEAALKVLDGRLPVFVLFNNYFRVRPLIHLRHLQQRLESKILDDAQYDYGNECLLRLLGFTAKELADLGDAPEPNPGDVAAMKTYRDKLDQRFYQLNAASVRLTEHIVGVWSPDEKRDEAARLKLSADRMYLRASVEDELGVEVELNQRSEGFQWLVSFFVVFFAEAQGKHKNAVLLLDEPGLSLHGLKQREFRKTVSRLAEKNQTLYSTHSPFLVGPDELDLVRVVEMKDRRVGTKVLTQITASDPAGLLPLQEALGYDLAQSLFAQQRNLVLEGLTDYWYVDALAELLREADMAKMNEKIALVPAASAGKVVYYATLLYAQKLKVAALLDSDAAGEQSAKQETLVHTLGNKRILRTKDAYSGPVTTPEIEDLLRSTLVSVAKGDAALKWDVSKKAGAQPTRPIVEVFADEIADFSKYKLAKAFLRWSRSHKASDLTGDEQEAAKKLVALINKALE